MRGHRLRLELTYVGPGYTVDKITPHADTDDEMPESGPPTDARETIAAGTLPQCKKVIAARCDELGAFCSAR